MKAVVFIASIVLLTVLGITNALVPLQPRLLGAKECTWGPSYWCTNITNAASCRAVKHCIQTVWEHKKLPPDQSSICQTCMDVVKQARDQLLSNMTESELKEVLEGSCDLIPIGVVAKECTKLVDQFLPELVDTLASEMDPQVVCHVSGLCNSERVTKLLADVQLQSTARPVMKTDSCSACQTVVQLVEKKFKRSSRDQVLQGMLKVCGKMSSLSDACSNIILTYFNEIYSHLLENLGSNEFCILSGECSGQFHQHTSSIQVTPLSSVGNVDVSERDDLPCDFCRQLVHHLRDVIVANTTEDEFQRVLTGICNQTKSFASECRSIVNEYYPEIYKFLSDEINGTVVCGLIGICPGPDLGENDDTPIVPLLPVQTVNKLQGNKRGSVSLTRGGSSVRIINPELLPESAQLPIERLMPQTLTMIGNTRLCTFCEYFLHYVQQAITDPKDEDAIKKVVGKACDHLPSSVNDTCWEFINTYGDAFVALLAQEIDPSVICPLLSVCKAEDSRDVDVFIKDNKGDKPNCPLCLFAVTKLEEIVKENKTEKEIRDELTKLCSHLSKQLKETCDTFVVTYADHIVDALLANLTPQEVCVYIKLCSATRTYGGIHLEPRGDSPIGGEILTNEIPDHTANGKTLISPTMSKQYSSLGCVVCEFVIAQLENVLSDNSTDEEIINNIKSVCSIMPKTVNEECTNFINKYGDIVMKLFMDKIAPQLICEMIAICMTEKEMLRDEVQTCAVCQGSLVTMLQLLQNPKISHDQAHVLEKTCKAMPLTYQEKCRQLLQVYGVDLFTKVTNYPTIGNICNEVGLCHNRVERDVLVGTKKCTWGPSYWCGSEDNALECGATKHCQERVWNGAKPPVTGN